MLRHKVNLILGLSIVLLFVVYGVFVYIEDPDSFRYGFSFFSIIGTLVVVFLISLSFLELIRLVRLNFGLGILVILVSIIIGVGSFFVVVKDTQCSLLPDGQTLGYARAWPIKTVECQSEFSDGQNFQDLFSPSPQIALVLDSIFWILLINAILVMTNPWHKKIKFKV